eukprot:TRINITY_DN10200_c0_g2_i5.p1 TRINITY_DN10200_c0_g2~~TRINITY_DN10200_c0_g2_i5.p1  ORF type:complete len:146 (-),score=22.33 TRINITY_DN10200_c0_g2_i5:18-455(-)
MNVSSELSYEQERILNDILDKGINDLCRSEHNSTPNDSRLGIRSYENPLLRVSNNSSFGQRHKLKQLVEDVRSSHAFNEQHFQLIKIAARVRNSAANYERMREELGLLQEKIKRLEIRISVDGKEFPLNAAVSYTHLTLPTTPYV